MTTTNFDDFSQNYKNVLDSSITISGEGSEYFFEYKARYVARIAGSKFSGKILDYGCGVGLLSASIKRVLPDSILHGYDVSADSIRKIGRDLLAQGKFFNDLGKLHNDYQLVILSNVMHHVAPQMRQSIISGIAPRLSRGGKFILFEHNPWNPMTRWVVQQCPFDADAILLRASETSRHLCAANLSVLKQDYIVFFPHMLSMLRPLEPWLAWLPLGAQYAVVGEKNAEG